MDKLSQYHIGVAAEAFAAGLLAHAGCDISVQYGANQPYYDLIAVRNNNTLRISVKGSQDGAWGLSQNYLKDANYHRAADEWFKRQPNNVAFMFVQFQKVQLGECPRAYLATPTEVLTQLKSNVRGRGDTILHENHTWTGRAHGRGTTDKIPDEWKFSLRRLDEMFNKRGT